MTTGQDNQNYINGLDTAECLVPSTAKTNEQKEKTARAVYSAGYRFVCRYYASFEDPKVLTRPEAEILTDAGLWIVTVFQDRNNTCQDFKFANGNKHGEAALNYAKNTINQPSGTAIYFAVDYDAHIEDVAEKTIICKYFNAVKDAFKGEYAVGVYGSGAVCAAVKTVCEVEHSWLAGANGWRGSSGYTGWNIKQSGTVTIDGTVFDKDVSNNTGGGGWRL